MGDAGETVRGSAGRFAPGTAPGPGRPKAATERAYLLAAAGACSLDDWAAVVATAVELAKAGDPAARTWLTNLLVGRDPPKLSRAMKDEPPPDDPPPPTS